MARKKDLPHNTEAEKSVLGAMLRSNQYLSDGLAKFSTDDFFEANQNHRVIFEAMKRLEERHVPVDPQTVTDELINSNTYDIAGGTEYLLELADSIVTFANISEYMNIVADQALLRKFLVKMEEISDAYYNTDIESVGKFLTQGGEAIANLVAERRISDFASAKEVSELLSKQIETIKPTTDDSSVIGVPTGFPEMNRILHGFQEGQFVVIAARPGVGKTALSLNLAYNAASRNKPVAYFSLEMPATDLMKRLVSAESNVPYETMITGFGIDNHKRLKLQESCKRLAKTKIYIDDTSGIQLADLVAKVRKLKNNVEPNLAMVVVDYIGLVRTNLKSRTDNRQLEVQTISQTLKNLALELKIPIIGVAQLNRNVETRAGNGEPVLADLRESGSIEQDADVVMMIAQTKIEQVGENPSKNIFERQHNEIQKLENEVAQKDKGPDTIMVNVFVRKNRQGTTGKIPLLFRRKYCKFDSPSKEAQEEIDALENERMSYFGNE